MEAVAAALQDGEGRERWKEDEGEPQVQQQQQAEKEEGNGEPDRQQGQEEGEGQVQQYDDEGVGEVEQQEGKAFGASLATASMAERAADSTSEGAFVSEVLGRSRSSGSSSNDITGMVKQTHLEVCKRVQQGSQRTSTALSCYGGNDSESAAAVGPGAGEGGGCTDSAAAPKSLGAALASLGVWLGSSSYRYVKERHAAQHIISLHHQNVGPGATSGEVQQLFAPCGTISSISMVPTKSGRLHIYVYFAASQQCISRTPAGAGEGHNRWAGCRCAGYNGEDV